MKGKMILERLDHKYFWDVDISRLDEEKSKRLIIERIISLGSLKEFHMLLDHYGENTVLKTAQQINYLDKKTLNFIALYFNQPIESFTCYTKRQSSQSHWNS